ncbi:MAG: hypothetical protein RBQ97_12280 [Acholeplasma sp.]|nr:hypothetical protein [Acholeplasma sp.]
MKTKLLFGVLLFLMVFTLSACDLLDINDTSHDDEYIQVSTYWAINEETKEVERLYYLPTVSNGIVFYDLDIDELEKVNETHSISYQLNGNYKIESESNLDLFMVKTLKWENISEIDYIYSDSKLEDDILVTYGDLPIISSNYKIGDTIRVVYQENNLLLHYALLREDYNLYIRYGDIRELLKGDINYV